MKKETWITIFSCLFFFVISFLYYLYFYGISVDEVWTYGFAHNIATALLPYRDFNMVITPLYPFLASLPLRIVDNIFVFHLTSALILTGIFYVLQKMDKPMAWVITSLLLVLYIFPTYNMLALLFVLCLIFLERKEKKNDFLIGLLLGCLVLTKQSIGVVCLIPSIYLIWKKKASFAKRGIGFLLPLVLFLLYLLLTSTFFACLNDTVLGLFEFKEKNGTYGLWFFLTLFLFGYWLYRFFIKKEHTEEILYTMCFLVTAYPLFDSSHFIVAMIPTLFLLGEGKWTNTKIKIPLLMVITLLTILIRGVTLHIEEHMTFEESDTKVLHYKFSSPSYLKMIEEVKTFVQKTEGNVYILNHQAYLIKLEANLPINRFDLINNGNMGYNGIEEYKKILDQRCQTEKCTFLIATENIKGEHLGQTSVELLIYVQENYHKKMEISSFTVFTNED